MTTRLAKHLAILGVLALALSFLGTGPTPVARAAATRIMPLGDSITGSPGCWRKILWNRLQSSGYTNIDFVGTLGEPGCGSGYDGNNEGHGGFQATLIAEQNQLPGWLSATNPDIVVMHLGTNDVWNNRSVTTILNAFSKLVDQMRANNPNMKIIVAKIIPMNPTNCSACSQRVVDLNNAIPGWASGKSTSASPVSVVDQWSGFSTRTDTKDGVHPNDSGNQKMSDKWYPAVTAALDSTNPPVTGINTGVYYKLVARHSGKVLDVNGASTADGANVQQWADRSGANQQWRFVDTGGGYYKLVNRKSGKVLDVAGASTADGANVQQWTDSSSANQQWRPVLVSTGVYRLLARHSGKALDVNAASTADGANIQQWADYNSANQQWQLVQVN